jgi:hypothetical protein
VIASPRAVRAREQRSAPADGGERVAVTGQLILREPPIPVEITAYVRGVVAEVLPRRASSSGARRVCQGIFGVGGETFGADRTRSRPNRSLTGGARRESIAARVVVGGSNVSYETWRRALGRRGGRRGRLRRHDLRNCWRDLGVAITGSEDFCLVLTEGFGTSDGRAHLELLGGAGQVASVSGATNRARSCAPRSWSRRTRAESDRSRLWAASTSAAAARDPEPYFGRIGRVAADELVALERGPRRVLGWFATTKPPRCRGPTWSGSPRDTRAR